MPEFTVEPSADSEMDDRIPNTNLGSDGTWEARFIAEAGTTTRRGILRFSLSSLPGEAIVNSATLKIRYQDAGGSATGRVNYVTDNFNVWTEAGVTWNSVIDGFVTWNTPGGDFDATDEASFLFSLGHPPDADINIDVRALVRRAITDGRTQLDIIVKRQFEATPTNGNTFYSKEDATPSNRPTLNVVYTGAGGLIPLLE